MPRYLIPRFLGEVDRDELERASEHATQVRINAFPEIEHEHTHVVRVDGGLKAYCVYRADDPERIRAHGEAAGLPVDEILEIETDLEPPPS